MADSPSQTNLQNGHGSYGIDGSVFLGIEGSLESLARQLSDLQSDNELIIRRATETAERSREMERQLGLIIKATREQHQHCKTYIESARIEREAALNEVRELAEQVKRLEEEKAGKEVAGGPRQKVQTYNKQKEAQNLSPARIFLPKQPTAQNPVEESAEAERGVGNSSIEKVSESKSQSEEAQHLNERAENDTSTWTDEKFSKHRGGGKTTAVSQDGMAAPAIMLPSTHPGSEPPLATQGPEITKRPPNNALFQFLHDHKDCIKGSPDAFFQWLMDSEGVKCLSDLASMVSSDEYIREVLQPGDGVIGVKGFKRAAFKKAVIAANHAHKTRSDYESSSFTVGFAPTMNQEHLASKEGVLMSVEQQLNPVQRTTKVQDYPHGRAPLFAAPGLHEIDGIKEGNSHGDDGPRQVWHCQACTYENSDSSLACEICETPSPSTVVETKSEDKLQQAMVTAKKADEAASKVTAPESKKRKKERRKQKKKEEAKAAAARAEMLAAEEERRQLEQARDERRAAVAKHEQRLLEEKKRDEEKNQMTEEHRAARAGEITGSTKHNLAPSPLSSDNLKTESPAKVDSLSSPTVLSAYVDTTRRACADTHRTRHKAAVAAVEGNRLASYMYPKTQLSCSSVSPIFDLLENPHTLPDARSLLECEAQISRLKKEAVDLRKKHGAYQDQSANLVEEKAGLEQHLQKRVAAVEKAATKDIEAVKKAASKELRKIQALLEKDMKLVEQKHTREWAKSEERRNIRIVDEETKEERDEIAAQANAERDRINDRAREEKKKITDKLEVDRHKLRDTVCPFEDEAEDHLKERAKALLRQASDELRKVDDAAAMKLKAIAREEKEKTEGIQRKRLEERKNGVGIFGHFRSVDEETKQERLQIDLDKSEETKRFESRAKAAREKSEEKASKDLDLIALGAKKQTEQIESDTRKRGELIDSRLAVLGVEMDNLIHETDLKNNQITKARKKIEKLKGCGEMEDDRFDINGSRDEYGRTFLVVATQNDDLETAQLCIKLGSNVNESNSEGLSALFFANYFKRGDMVELLARNGGTIPNEVIWDGVLNGDTESIGEVDWETQLRISEKAAIPTDTLLASADTLEKDEEWRMGTLTAKERNRDFVFFDASLVDPNLLTIRRVVLLDSGVYSWLSEANESAARDARQPNRKPIAGPAASFEPNRKPITGPAVSFDAFLDFLDALKPAEYRNRKNAVANGVSCHRRAVVGVKNPYEVLSAPLYPKTSIEAGSTIILFSPFVSSEKDGVTSVGVLIWAVTQESRASLFKTLIEEAEFRRHKIEFPGERFPPHRDAVLELGKDMHLLDLKSKSVWTSSPMELYMVNADDEEALGQLGAKGYKPQKRMVEHEQQIRAAIFRTSDSEMKENQDILSGARIDMSTFLTGGAGTGKTLLMVKKIASEDKSKRILVVSRLPRLVLKMKSSVEAERDTSSVTFQTYDDLMTTLVRSVESTEEHMKFSSFSQVHFSETTGTGASNASVSFLKDFYEGFLEEGERRALRNNEIEPITLWTSFRTIKSNYKCSVTKEPLSRQEYIGLPRIFGLNQAQRKLVYDTFAKYEKWLVLPFKWDEADRVLYILKYGSGVFADSPFISWQDRVSQFGEVELLQDNEVPRSPFFYDMICADEAQDFSDLDLSLFIRMSSGVRYVFFGADPAQSVEVGIRMRAGTVNDVFNVNLPANEPCTQVKHVLQHIPMKTNHRTHAQNLMIAQEVRKILTRSFGVPRAVENALINGPMPEALLLKSLQCLGDENVFRGGNVVFITPDENVISLRGTFLQLGIKNDVFGVREAKGLEFDSVSLVGFFSYFESRGNAHQWENVLRWLSSTKGLTTTESGEKVYGKVLENCDYVLSHPEIEDQAMMFYTALTRSRNHLYFVEVESGSKKKKGLADFAFRRFKDLRLLKRVGSIDEGFVEMTPQQHKARGVLMVTQAVDMSRNNEQPNLVKAKFLEAAEHFRPDKGNDKDLLDKCNKHLNAVMMKNTIMEKVRTIFFDRDSGEYVLEGQFADVLVFEEEIAKYFRMCIGDSFLIDEVHEVRALVEDIFWGTPYENHFRAILDALKQAEG